VKRIAGVSVAMEDEVPGDGAFGDMNDGAVRATQGYGSESVPDGGMGDVVAGGVEVRALKFYGPPGKGGRRSEVVESGGGVGVAKEIHCLS
jgi:hypothetical protein